MWYISDKIYNDKKKNKQKELFLIIVYNIFIVFTKEEMIDFAFIFIYYQWYCSDFHFIYQKIFKMPMPSEIFIKIIVSNRHTFIIEVKVKTFIIDYSIYIVVIILYNNRI